MIPRGPDPAVGVVNSALASVVGLNIPIALAAYSVNQRFLSGPVVIPPEELPEKVTAREIELGDGGNARKHATIFQPFEPEPCPVPRPVLGAMA